MKSLTAAQMRETDRRTIEDYKIPGIILMENAGRGATDAAMKLIEGGEPVGVFAGKGHNGGDAFVIARHLHNRGVPVEVFLIGGMENMPADDEAVVNMNILPNMGIPVNRLAEEADVEKLDMDGFSLIVDGLFGIGVSGEVRGLYKSLIEKMNASPVKKFAVDIPSGLSADEGVPLGTAVRAAATATFGAPKAGFEKPGASDYTGAVTVVEISIPRELLEEQF